MRLKNVTLKNFRCFEHLELMLHPRLTVIVGENGAGKTAVLDGIALGLSRVVSNLSTASQRLAARSFKDTDARVYPWKNDKSGKITTRMSDYSQVIVDADTVDLKGSLNRQPLRWDTWKGYEPKAQPEEKIGVQDLRDYLSRIQSTYYLDPQPPPVLAYYGTGRGDIKVPTHPASGSVNYAHPNSALYRALDSSSRLTEALEWFYAEESAELRANKEAGPNKGLSSPTLLLVRSAIENILGGEYTDPHFDKNNIFFVRRKKDGVLLQVEQLSQGYQSMLGLAIDFSRRMGLANNYAYDVYWKVNADSANNPNGIKKGIEFLSSVASVTPSIMIVDEIDLHLHPTWQQRVLLDLRRTFPLTQFIVTTHSPQVLSSVDKACIRQLQEETTPDTGKRKIVVKGVDLQTKGVASSDLLAEIMGVDPIPDIPEAHWVSDFHALIQQNLHETADGKNLRARIEQHFGADHPVMRNIDRMVRLQQFKQRLPRDLGKAAH